MAFWDLSDEDIVITIDPMRSRTLVDGKLESDPVPLLNSRRARRRRQPLLVI